MKYNGIKKYRCVLYYNAVKIVPRYENGRCCLNQMEFASWFKENAYCEKYIIHFDIRIYKWIHFDFCRMNIYIDSIVTGFHCWKMLNLFTDNATYWRYCRNSTRFCLIILHIRCIAGFSSQAKVRIDFWCTVS